VYYFSRWKTTQIKFYDIGQAVKILKTVLKVLKYKESEFPFSSHYSLLVKRFAISAVEKAYFLDLPVDTESMSKFKLFYNSETDDTMQKF
jgi:hypothetical protein